MKSARLIVPAIIFISLGLSVMASEFFLWLTIAAIAWEYIKRIYNTRSYWDFFITIFVFWVLAHFIVVSLASVTGFDGSFQDIKLAGVKLFLIFLIHGIAITFLSIEFRKIFGLKTGWRTYLR